MRLSCTVYTFIENEVANFIEDWGIQHYPFNLNTLCKQMGICLKPYSSLPPAERGLAMSISEDAFHVADSRSPIPTFTIIYNDATDRRRIKFSIAHELGHIILEHESHSEQNEAEANYFAGYLLAPDPLVIKWCARFDVDDIAERFDVSYSCAKVAASHAINRIHCGKVTASHEDHILERFMSKEVIQLGA